MQFASVLSTVEARRDHHSKAVDLLFHLTAKTRALGTTMLRIVVPLDSSEICANLIQWPRKGYSQGIENIFGRHFPSNSVI